MVAITLECNYVWMSSLTPAWCPWPARGTSQSFRLAHGFLPLTGWAETIVGTLTACSSSYTYQFDCIKSLPRNIQPLGRYFVNSLDGTKQVKSNGWKLCSYQPSYIVQDQDAIYLCILPQERCMQCAKGNATYIPCVIRLGFHVIA